MATLILTAVGTVIGGPLGGAIGALVGRQVDAAIIGGRKAEGPRLKELSVQTSSYGNALPRHFGRMRAAGTVIWATELKEQRESQGGGKGPSVTSYSYSASFAVALASRPIKGIGKVWADGNLLRGSAGDLKVGGAMRVHTGHGDQMPDPLLIQAEAGGRCPAYRQLAYVVFEDLQLADFGNRLPSLTFEILADEGDCSIEAIIADIVPEATLDNLSATFAGFTIDQGSAGDALAVISQGVPLSCATIDERLVVRRADAGFPIDAPLLPLPAASQDPQADKARMDGWSRRREPRPNARLAGLRYYDVARDYQPGLQRGLGRSEQGDVAMVELPAALTAESAVALANAASRRMSRARDTISYRITEIDPVHSPGAFVRLPVASGLWRIDQWEWQKDGVLLDLSSCVSRDTVPVAISRVDGGRLNLAPDLVASPTTLAAFELPWDGIGSGASPALFVAACGVTAGWTGASLFAEREGAASGLVAIGSTGRRRAIIGRLQSVLPPASPLLVDRTTTFDVQLADIDLSLPTSDLPQLLQGANRALVGAEIIQFANASPIGSGAWRLSGLLRGRGGTEWAIGGHAPGESFVLIDDALHSLDPALVGDAATTRIVAAGLGDSEPVTVSIACAGATLRPLSPVHGSAMRQSDGGLIISWVRRSRGSWFWPDLIETLINEEAELWDVTYGDTAAPAQRWQVDAARLTLSSAQLTALAALSVPSVFNVRQLGRAAASASLRIAIPA